MSRSIDELKESILADMLTTVVDLQVAIEKLPLELDKSLLKYADALEESEKTFNLMKEENALLLKNQANSSLIDIKSKIESEIINALNKKTQPISTSKIKIVPLISLTLFSLVFGFIGVLGGISIYKSELNKLEKDSITLMLQDKAINNLSPEIKRQISAEYAKQVDQHYSQQ